jgi:lysophospholipase L1-like esterase
VTAWAVVASVVLGVAGATTATATGTTNTAGATAATNTAGATAATVAADSLVTGHGDFDGYHLYVARSDRGTWSWRPLASIAPFTSSSGTWIGEQCQTGDGRYVVAVVAPSFVANTPAGLATGGLAYAVDVTSGQVKPLARGVALNYFTPGCGPGSTATLTSYRDDETRSQVALADAATGRLVWTRALPWQATNAVPVGTGTDVVAVRGGDLVRFDRSASPRTLASESGQPFRLRPAADGSVAYLVTGKANGTDARVVSVDGKRSAIGSGRAGRADLFGGRGGRPVSLSISGAPASSPTIAAQADPGNAPVEAASLDGGALLLPTRAVTGSAVAGRRETLAVTGSAKPVTAALPTPAPATSAQPTITVAGTTAAAATASPCAVGRNDIHRQVRQPNSAQASWAIELATRGVLSVTRPAGAFGMGLGAYQPSTDFARISLTGSPNTPVPAQVERGILSQESNWQQATFHAIPGVAGNPLIADYYGAGGGDSAINYALADCGYGLGQVTTGMRTGGMNTSLQAKVAVDYAENIAASMQLLEQKWNELKTANVTMGDGDPSELENWYFALWDYNSGYHANTGSGPYGLGWTNNPVNASYPPDRDGYLRATYADAEHPERWPYQEKVFGWMETAQLDLAGNPRYPTPSDYLRIPSHTAFCSLSANECDPTYQNGSLSYCMRSDRECWWHSHSDAVCSTAGTCTQMPATYLPGDPEPAWSNPHPADCNLASTDVPAGSVVVDDEEPDVNLAGCPSPPTAWTNAGTFTATFAQDSSGQPVGAIDWHQLGVGFGGHIWFTHARAPSDEVHHDYGVWQPNAGAIHDGYYRLKAHLPDTGAQASQVVYEIDNGAGTTLPVVSDQRTTTNTWRNLGVFHLYPGAKVTLGNQTANGGDSTVNSKSDIAYDALAFIPIAKPPHSYVAMGDSYSSGEGLQPFFPDSDQHPNGADADTCHRSTRAYSQLVHDSTSTTPLAHDGASEVRFIACSGSTTENVVRGGTSNGGEIAQLNQNTLSTDTDLVTISIGGNDAFFAKMITLCAQSDCMNPGTTVNGVPVTQFEAQTIDNLEPTLENVYWEIKNEAPNARVVVLGYPRLFGTGDCPSSVGALIAGDERVWFDQMADRLDSVITTAATTQGVTTLAQNVVDRFTGHGLCGSDSWLNPLLLFGSSGSGSSTLDPGSFHPNEAGQANYAAIVNNYLTSVGY